ncbi:MAG: acetylornithine transaminase [Candidatus Delongbacteria bacterium]|nr:acetylornithine transaminase [Candidatus Delongbacteria bacterium]MCG2760631.1 acetylornithine transaminase [Candidatus Delongbacteria bacterium]
MTKYEKYFIPVYKRLKHKVEFAHGSTIYTKDGAYLDMFSGLGVNILGYFNKRVVNEISLQLSRYSHLSNYFEAEPVGKLAKYLVNNTFAEKVFFSNSGTEAVEAGLKIIRKYGKDNDRNNIITFTKAFHGRTLGAASVTAPDKSSVYNHSAVPNIITLEFNNENDLDKIDGNTAGVFIEIIQGQGGINVADKAFIKKLKERTDKFKAVLMIDEIQSGMGRTGKLFSFEHYGIVPDLAVIAKAIGGGLPLGALLANKEFCDYLTYGEHGSTFGGNPVSCAAGLATIKQINNEKFLCSVSQKGEMLKEEILKLKHRYPEKIGRISGLGLMIGIEILKNEDKVMELFEKEKIFVNMTRGNILRLLPPLIITEEEIKHFVEKFETVLSKMNQIK